MKTEIDYSYKRYLEAKKDYEDAIRWVNFDLSVDDDGRPKYIPSVSKSEFNLIKIDFENKFNEPTPSALATEILTTIITNKSIRDSIMGFSLQQLQKRMNAALIDCELELRTLLGGIEAAKNEKSDIEIVSEEETGKEEKIEEEDSKMGFIGKPESKKSKKGKKSE